MRSWVTPQLGGDGKGRARSRERVDRLARQRVEGVAAPGVALQRRKRVAAHLAENLWLGDLAGLRALTGELATVIDPDGVGRRVGAPGASVDAASEIELIYLSHLGAEAVVTGRPALTDIDWEEARQMLRVGWLGYAANQPQLAATATNPELFVEPTLSHQLARCSAALLLVLGGRIAERG